jgi:diaminopimelate decarboxylase
MTASAWARRPTDEEIRDVLVAGRTQGLVGEVDTAVVFHDLDLLDDRLDELVAAFPPSALHTIAIKANPLVEVLRAVVARGCGLEAASFEEVMLARAAGCPPDRIVFDSPAKSVAELQASLELGIRLNADNFVELDRIIELRPPDSTSIVGLRVNPLVGDGSIPTTSVAGTASRFGVRIDRVVEGLVPRATGNPWIRGLHHHVGSQGIAVDAHAAAAAATAALRDQLHDALGRPQFDTVDIGGGATTDYVGEGPTEPAEFVAAVSEAAPSLFDADTVLMTEFGRAVQANCGWAASTVEYVKESSEGDIAVLHLGADFLMRPAYQPEHWQHRFSVVDATPGADPSTPWIVSGPLCFAGDIIGRSVPLGPVTAGDTVVVHDVGAYTVGMWSRHCSRGIPLVLGHRRSPTGEIRFDVLRARESPEDVVRFWSADPFAHAVDPV